MAGPIKILDSESFYLPNVKMNIIENGYNFWVGNYSRMSRGKIVPDGKMTKVSVSNYIACGIHRHFTLYFYLHELLSVLCNILIGHFTRIV